MNDQFKYRLKRTLIICTVGLVIGAGLGLAQIKAAQNAVAINKGTTADGQTVPGVQIGGSFSLTDQDGKLVTDKSYPGQYRIVYFGFTMCPMICPTGLQKIAKALDILGPTGEKIQPILITVDPERDKPDVLKLYVRQFHPRLVGLTGPKSDIDNVVKEYKVFANKVEDNNMSDYTMDHSSFAYLMSPSGDLLALYRDADTAEMMAADIKSKIE